ncbi:MAG: SPOR domain-containing protein [Sulfuricella sp.]|nr:SPOR domain-containing protein [Sulfuricella sp.]
MPEQPSLDEQTEIKKRAIRRVIAASVLVAAAIAALTVLTRYKPEIPATRTTTQNTEIAPAQPAAPPEEMAAPPTTPSEQEVQPTTPPPPPPEVVNAAPAAPAPKEAKPMPVRPGAEAEVSARPTPAKPAAAPAPMAQAAPAKPQPLKPAPAEKTPPLPAKAPEAAITKGYSVQLGVFSNPANAIQLQEKLTQNGIKSYTETKLNVGPFQSKAEAEQAMAKIRALGLSAVVVPAR